MSGNREEELVVVFRSPKENLANIVRSLLESEGVPVTLRSNLTASVYDGIFATRDGYFCDLLVPADRAKEAKELIAAYDNKG